MVLDALDDPAQKFFVAEESGRPAAFARVYFEEKSFGMACEVETLVVDEDRRGGGMGDRLLLHLEKEAKKAGARAMRVNVLSVNDEGRRFYEGRGYAMVAARYGKDL